MKRFFQWLFIFLFLCSASVFDVAAQIVMEKGADNPVIYAHVINEKGEFLGLTDTEGRLPELKESKTLNISHVAYNPVTVEVGKGLYHSYAMLPLVKDAEDGYKHFKEYISK